MITSIIIDDEKHCIDRLENLLKDFCAEVKVLAKCSDIDTAFEKIKMLKPDVIFLDVQINEFTGFDLLKKFDKIDFEIIFMTAFEHYAVQAFRFSALDFLLKPIDAGELVSAVEKFTNKSSSASPDISNSGNIEILLQNLQNIRTQNKKITIPTIYGFEVIATQDILYCKSDVNYTTLVLKDEKTFTVARTLKDFEGVLEPYRFFRINNSYIVNLDYVKSYHKGNGGFVTLENNTEIEVSSRRKDEFFKKMEKQV